MKHYTYDEWMNYVKDDINESNREELESHLYSCDQCLDVYLQAVSANETSLPTLSNESNFTDLVMTEVAKQKEVVPDTNSNLNTVRRVPSVPDTNSNLNTVQRVPVVPDTTTTKRKPFYQQAVFHYLLAAVATILLMFSGAFQSIVSYGKAIETPPQLQRKTPSVTEGVINKTFAWMDSLEKKEAVKK